uniref:Kinase n=1 Tax=Dermatophagoides pteronyssinus TaxID=6956 RepID=A0A6P6YE26_DERPT|nr:inositol-trisphosphate 3-kinase A-like [Dermatophagoides pteronyssinus]
MFLLLSNSSSLIQTIQWISSKWRKVRSLVTSPFIQTYKRKKYPWIQLAGHQGNFVAGQIQGTIMKKLCGNEIDCFQKLMSDPQLSVLVPEFKNIRIVNGDTYLELEDLLATFVNPSVMDIKMGIRTYLEEELVKANEKPRLRKDMYEKMVAIDPEEPSNEEKEQKAITKPRYMVWRETISSTSTLGFRIDGMKSGDNHHRLKTTTATVKDFKRTKSIESVRSAILEFVGDKHEYLITYLEKLKFIRKQLEQSKFFQTHEMIGSSLLLVHDQQHANIWMIDFAKTYPLPDDININHRDQWTLGNHEDGYLFGLDNLIEIFSSLCCNSSTSSSTTTTTPSSS